MPNKLSAELWDKMHYLFRDFNDRMVHVELNYDFVLDIDADADESKKIADSLCATARLFLSKFPVIAAPLKSVYGQNADKLRSDLHREFP